MLSLTGPRGERSSGCVCLFVKPPIPDTPGPSQDAGVKAMVTGLVSASARFLLSSSFNGSGSNECQKPHSKYIDLVAELRLDVLGKDPQSVGQMFPSEDEPAATTPLVLACFVVFVGAVVVADYLARKTDSDGKGKNVKLP